MSLFKYLKDNLFFLLIFSFVFISSVSLSLSGTGKVEPVDLKDSFAFDNLPPIPALSGQVNYFPTLSAQAVLAVDMDSGVTLFEKNADETLLPASTTKIVTALVALDAYKESDVLTIKGVQVEGQKMGLVKGEKLKVEDLLYGLLIYSANDAAEELAANYCVPNTTEKLCGRNYFIAAMNEKAKELNLTNTHFENPVGLDGKTHVSTARDLVRAAKIAMQDKRFSQIVATTKYLAKSEDGKIVHNLKNINELVGTVDGVLGVKTGWTENARENLVTYIKRDNKKVMIALLGSQDRFGETKELIDWIFSSYEWKKINL